MIYDGPSIGIVVFLLNVPVACQNRLILWQMNLEGCNEIYALDTSAVL
jgi:hypothetical protein